MRLLNKLGLSRRSTHDAASAPQNDTSDSTHTESSEPSTHAAVGDSQWLEVARRWELVSNNNQDDVEARLQLVNAYTELGRDADLQQLIEDLDGRFKSVQRAQILVARHYLKTGADEVALDRWLTLEQQYPDLLEATSNLAHLYLRADQPEEALTRASKLDEQDETIDKAHRIRARVYQRQQEWTQAADSWRAVLANSPTDEDAKLQLAMVHLRSDDPESAIALIDETPSASQSKAYLQLKQRALMKLQRLEDALEVGEHIESMDTNNTDVLMEQATILFRLDRHAEAEKYCQRLLDRSPSDIRVLTLYARIGQALASQQKAG